MHAGRLEGERGFFRCLKKKIGCCFPVCIGQAIENVAVDGNNKPIEAVLISGISIIS